LSTGADRLAVGVVGIGFGQAVLVPAFRTDPACEVLAIAASSEGRARRVADRLGIPEAAGDWHALVSDPRITALAVAVPPALQPAIVIAAAHAGKHVFCEKPAATTVDDARAMAAAVGEGKVVHAIDFEFPELRSWNELKAACAQGRLGAMSRMYIDWRVRGRSEAEARSSWKANDEEGGGLWGGFLPHSLYHLEWLGGPLRRVRARRTHDGRAFQLWGDFAGGATATITLDAGPVASSGHRVEVVGTTGSAILDNPTPDHAGPFTLSLDRVPLLTDPATEGSDGRVTAVASLARKFLDAVRRRSHTSPDLGDGLRVQELLDAAVRSARRDDWVKV